MVEIHIFLIIQLGYPKAGVQRTNKPLPICLLSTHMTHGILEDLKEPSN